MDAEPDNLFHLSEDDGSLVITLIDPTVFHNLMNNARNGPLSHLPEASFHDVPEHDLIAHDFVQAYGLVMIPPLPAPAATLSLDALKEECEKRRVGVVSGSIAYALARLCNARGPLATEAAFDHIVLTPRIINYLRDDIAANDFDRGGTYIDLNSKSERGVQNLMGALIRRWGKHIRVIDQPDEAPVTDLALSMAVLQSACWEHPSRNAAEATTANIILDQDIQFNIPGLQGLALGNKLHKSIRLSIKGLPLTGLGSRIRAYVKIESNIVPDENGAISDNAEDDEDDEALQPYDILRDSVKGLVRLKCLVDAPQDPTDQEINTSAAISFSPLPSPPTPDDMAALKQIILSARKLESLTVMGNMENPPDGRAGAFIPASAGSGPHPAISDFYLPAFEFLPQDHFPPLLHLHLWRYDWRRHSNFDVETHWDFSRLQALIFEGAPLRWFLGTLRMTDLGFIHTLRLEDAEWALRPLQSQQAAIIIGYILSYFVHSLRRLELIRVYTDHVPLAALRRHAPSLEHVALRHPYGIGFGPGGLTPSMASRMLLAMLQRGDEVSNGMNVMSVALGGNGVVHPTTPNANSEPHETMPTSLMPIRPATATGPSEAEGSNANGTATTFHGTGASGVNRADNIDSVNNAAGVDASPIAGASQPAVVSRLAPSLSRLLSPDIDTDDRLVADKQEPEVLTRLMHLPQLRRVTVAVPSALHGLSSEPRYDVDLNSVLMRLVYMLNQRQQLIFHQQTLHHHQQGRRTQGTMELLEQVVFYIDGWEPNQDVDSDRHGGCHPDFEEEDGPGDAESASTSATIINAYTGSSTAMAQCVRQSTAAAVAAAVPAATVTRRPLTTTAPLAGAMHPSKRCLVAELVQLSSIESSRRRSHESDEDEDGDAMEEDHEDKGKQPATSRSRSSGGTAGASSAARGGDATTGSGSSAAGVAGPVSSFEAADALGLSSSSSAPGSELLRSSHGAYNSTQYVYILYEEFNDECAQRPATLMPPPASAGVHHVPEDLDDHSAYVNERGQTQTTSYADMAQRGACQRRRVELPYMVQFARPSDLSDPKWDAFGVPLWEENTA